MLQNHSSPLFCRPMTYFGSYQNMEEEIFGGEIDFADPWSLALEKELVFSLRPNIGIFIHWQDSQLELQQQCDEEY